ncbi:MAG: hypothetical protein U1F43_33350 [Myxococcota bacterium]
MQQLIAMFVALALVACGKKETREPSAPSPDAAPASSPDAAPASAPASAPDAAPAVAPDTAVASVAAPADATVAEPSDATVAAPTDAAAAPERRACIDGHPHPRSADGDVEALPDGHTIRFTIGDATFTYDLEREVLTPVPAPPAAPEPPQSALRSDDEGHVLLCAPDGSGCAPLEGAGTADHLTLDEGDGLAFVLAGTKLTVFDRATRKALATRDVGHKDDSATGVRVVGPAVVVGYNCECISGPPMNPALFDKRTLKPLGLLAPAVYLHSDTPALWPAGGDVAAVVDSWGSLVVLQDLKTGKVVGTVDLVSTTSPSERLDEDNVHTHGMVQSLLLAPGKLLVVHGARSFGELVVVDLAARSIAARHRMPFCDETPSAKLACVPAAAPPVLDGEELVANRFVGCSKVGEAETCFALDLGDGSLGGLDAMPAPLDEDHVGPLTPWQLEPALEDALTLSEARISPDGARVYAIYTAEAGAPALAYVFRPDDGKRLAKATVGTKATPCAEVQPLGAAVLFALGDCADQRGDAWLADGKTLKRIAPLGGDVAFARGKRVLAVGGAPDTVALAQPGGHEVVLQSLSDGAIVKRVDLSAAVGASGIEALYRRRDGALEVRSGLDFARVDPGSGEVGARVSAPVCH